MIGQFWYLFYNSKTRQHDIKVSVEDTYLNTDTVAAIKKLASVRERGSKRPYAVLRFKPSTATVHKAYKNAPGEWIRDRGRSKFISAASAVAHTLKAKLSDANVLYFKFDPETLMYNEISFEDVTAAAIAEKPEPKRRKKNG